jgi:hypothetical protein
LVFQVVDLHYIDPPVANWRERGPIPIRGTLHGTPYQQTLVKYAGAWRLYINMVMLKNSPQRIGEVVEITIEHDPEPLEINRYLARLKTEESRERNIERAIQYLLGKGRFVGRDTP